MKAFKILLLLVFLLITGCLYVPGEDATIQGNININDFDSFNVEIGKGLNPQYYKEEGISLRYDGKKALKDEAIARIDSDSLNEGVNTIRISVRDKKGNMFYDYLYLYADNEAVTYPLDGSVFTLVVERPANQAPIYYIIAEYPLPEIDEPDDEITPFNENETEIRIQGSKINITGKLDKESISRYEIDYSYEDNRIWYRDGVELINSPGDLLGTLDLKELKYEGFLTLRVKIFKTDGEVNTEISRIYVVSEIYEQLEYVEPSTVENIGDERVDGFLSISVDKKTNEPGFSEEGCNKVYEDCMVDLKLRGCRNTECLDSQKWICEDKEKECSAGLWAEYKKIKDKIPFTLFGKQVVALTRVNLGGLSIDEPGTYRINVLFERNGKIESGSYEFEVARRTEYVDSCTDETPRSACSIEMKSYYCDKDLKLVQKCQYCGCEEGLTCSGSGQCASTTPPIDRTPRKGPQI